MPSMSRKLNYKLILRFLGNVVFIVGLFMLLPLLFSWYYGSGDLRGILLSAVVTIVSGGVIWLLGWSPRKRQAGKRDAYVIVTFTWVAIAFFGALPFVFTGAIPSYGDAFFEAMSGFTTTGASILDDIESLPQGVLFWRSLTHWLGGMGIIVLSLAILPLLGIGGMQLFTAEASASASDKLHPRVAVTAKRLYGVYLLLTLVLSLLLLLGGMTVFDALCHAFATVSTGGFSPNNDSIAGYSAYIQYVITVFMILGGINFALHYMTLTGKFQKALKNEELRYFLKLLIISATAISLLLIIRTGMNGEEAFRHALFQTVSIATTTGFVTTDYLAWPSYIWIILFFLMFTGGATGSTSGGLKAARQLMVFKISAAEFRKQLHPRAVVPVRLNGKGVPGDIVHNIMAFLLIYVLIFATGTLVMVLMGLDLETAMGSSIGTLGNIGPGIGAVGPVDNYALIPAPGKWFLSFLMLLGRLELFTVLILFSSRFWKE